MLRRGRAGAGAQGLLESFDSCPVGMTAAVSVGSGPLGMEKQLGSCGSVGFASVLGLIQVWMWVLEGESGSSIEKECISGMHATRADQLSHPALRMPWAVRHSTSSLLQCVCLSHSTTCNCAVQHHLQAVMPRGAGPAFQASLLTPSCCHRWGCMPAVRNLRRLAAVPRWHCRAGGRCSCSQPAVWMHN